MKVAAYQAPLSATSSAAVFHKGSVAGIYRKLYPAINRSVYGAGDQMPVFTVGGLTFGIVIYLDSNYYGPAGIMASRGAAALLVPTNNGLPRRKRGRDWSPRRGTVTSPGRSRMAFP